MSKLVLYTKSYSGDLERLKISIESIKKFNKDNIPYYVSVPSAELNLFKNNIDCSYVNLVSDDDIYPVHTQNWNTQQIVKSNFWKLGLCENYVCIDSDGYFIRPFGLEDFMYDHNTPYTVMHEQKELFSWTSANSHLLGFDPKQSFKVDRQTVMDVFDRSGRCYDFGPVPVIWSNKVWKSLEENYTQVNELTFDQLIAYSPSEFTWYGEALLAFKAIEIYPIEPLFKVFHFHQQLIEYKQQNITEDMIAQNYMGIVLQSNFNAPLNY
jgi:hypothetical protein